MPYYIPFVIHTHNYDANVKNILITYQLVYRKLLKKYGYVCSTDDALVFEPFSVPIRGAA